MRRVSALISVGMLLIAMLPVSLIGQEKQKIDLKPVLLVMDVQNIWLPHMSGEDRAGAMENINRLIELFREYERPIIRVYHSDTDLGPEPGTGPFEFPKTIHVKDDDPMIVKNYPNSFRKTDLEKALREDDCNALFLCGLSATGCVLATYYGGLDRGFMTVMVEGALLSPNASYTRVVEDICNSMTLMEVEETLKDP